MSQMAIKHRIVISLGLVVIIVCSASWAIYVLGLVPIDIHNNNWLWGDLSQVYTAWVQYLNDPGATWLKSNRMSYPLDMNFSLFDPMPILLLTLKPFAYGFTKGNQYIGLYFVLCLILQGTFGYFIVGEVLRRNSPRDGIITELIKVIGGLFFVLAPYTYFRFQGHTSLSSQWLLVLSIWVLLRTRHSSTWVWIVLNGLVIFLATGFHPYHAFMIGISATVFEIAESKLKTIPKSILRVTCLAGVSIAGIYLFGFFAAAGVDYGGYGIYSMNILGPLDSNGTANLFPIDISDATGGQSFEGYSYLGIGVVIFFVAAIIIYCRSRPSNAEFPFETAFLIIAISYLLAISTKVTFSSMSFQVPVPDIVNYTLSKFRASGRLFWIGGFWIIAISIATLIITTPKKHALIIIAGLFFIQLIDVAGVSSNIRHCISGFQRLNPSLENLFTNDRSEAVIVLPPWQCDHEETPGGIRNYEIFGFLSINKHIPTNNFYAARTLPEQSNFHCNYDELVKRLSKKNIYFLSADFYTKFHGYFTNDFECANSTSIDNTVICRGAKGDS